MPTHSLITPSRFGSGIDVAAYKAAVLADGPRVFWEMNEGSGTTITDLSVNGHDGTASNTTWTTPGPLNQTNALLYGGEGSDDNVQVTSTSNFDGTSIAASCWFKGTSTILGRVQFSLAFSSSNFRLTMEASTLSIWRYSVSNRTQYSLSHGINPDDGNWHWACWKYTSSAFTAGCDGGDLGSVATSGNLNTASRPLVAGAGNDTNASTWAGELNGRLALVAYWPNPTISVADMIEHYDAGVP